MHINYSHAFESIAQIRAKYRVSRASRTRVRKERQEETSTPVQTVSAKIPRSPWIERRRPVGIDRLLINRAMQREHSFLSTAPIPCPGEMLVIDCVSSNRMTSVHPSLTLGVNIAIQVLPARTSSYRNSYLIRNNAVRICFLSDFVYQINLTNLALTKNSSYLSYKCSSIAVDRCSILWNRSCINLCTVPDFSCRTILDSSTTYFLESRKRQP